MNETKFKTISEVWNAIEAGYTIHCASKAYELVVVDTNIDWRKEQGFETPFSNKDGKSLRVTCMSNWFGSLLQENELSQLFVKETV